MIFISHTKFYSLRSLFKGTGCRQGGREGLILPITSLSFFDRMYIVTGVWYLAKVRSGILWTVLV